ncbi:hypothetical protein DPMN_045497 [Dreissena polymorpha]|uniref:C2H2-type domain-containing protein n=1 Tax=Dreissena polymorpha TaxID=45954 RepID=A0A9D4D636_DREPO|nr:hypothetical protein DPMN_045497 [Dreissena polymorpha]
MGPTKCNSCDAGPFSSYSSYQRHRVMKHSETDTIFQCSLCSKTFGRRKDGVAHQRKQHKYSGQLTPETMRNMNYIDPYGVLPYKMDHSERLRQNRKQSEVAPDLTTRRADCRHEETTFDEEGKPVTFQNK